MAVVVLLVAAGTGTLLRDLPRDPGASSSAGPGGNAGTNGSGPAGSATSVIAPAEQPGPKTVSFVEDVAAHPKAEQVRALLQDYFDAINKGDYDLWTSTVTADRARDTGRRAWYDQYRSTLDGSIVVHRLQPRPGGGLIALISFTSVQDPADAPPDLPVRCLRWRVSYPLLDEGGELRLGPASPNASLRTPC